MPISVTITRDFDAMSSASAEFVVNQLTNHNTGRGYVLGLATGISPTGMYRHLARTCNDGVFDPTTVTTFNLDEYLGLPGADAQQRTLNPESYAYFMVQEFFGLLRRKFASSQFPPAHIVDPKRLVAELEANPDDYTVCGTSAGKAIDIITKPASKYLEWLRNDVLGAYQRTIKAVGGIDLQVIGVGQRGHVAFHEAGIDFDDHEMLLVKLDENTRNNAVADRHFTNLDDCPMYAVSMGVSLVFQARRVLCLACGERKTSAITRALLDPVTPDMPLSYGQTYAANGGDLQFFVDVTAARGLLERADEVRARGIHVVDRSSEQAEVLVRDLVFRRDPKTGLN